LSTETIVVLLLTAIVAANLIWLELKTRRSARAAASAETPQPAEDAKPAEANPKKKARS
jgi:hypothetical protein